MMLLFVKDVAGRQLSISADPGSDIGSVKRQISSVCGVPVEVQRLIFGGRSLESSQMLGECGLTDESTVFLGLELSGGGKKRKKKTYTKPKKIKHKRKKSEACSVEVLQS